MFKRLKGYQYKFRTLMYYWSHGCYKNNNSNSMILMFHDVNDSETNILKYVSNIDEFCAFITELKTERQVCSVLKIAEDVEIKNAFAISFDDAFKSVYTHVYPFMKENQIPFTVFVTIDFVGKEGYITKEQLFELDADPLCLIGAHSVTHPLLRKCGNSFEEILESKKQLEVLLQHEIPLFAYPYGSLFACSKKNIKEVKKSGFLYAFSAINGYMNGWARRRKYFLPRFNGDLLVCAHNSTKERNKK